jgi:antitoxin (DNA-binding transcriptional repressor) of toxin-antitoxin stability system
MPTITVEVGELPGRFADILSLAAGGTEIIVTQGNVPQARLVPLPLGRARTPGLHPGAIQTSEDFDAPLPEDYWTGTP